MCRNNFHSMNALFYLNMILQRAMLNPRPTLFEYRGPSGVLVVITANTDNKARTRADINYFAKRHGYILYYDYTYLKHLFNSHYENIYSFFRLIKTEGIRSAFDHKGFIYAKPPPDVSNPDEKALDDAIEVGAEEVKRDDENPDILVVGYETDHSFFLIIENSGSNLSFCNSLAVKLRIAIVSDPN